MGIFLTKSRFTKVQVFRAIFPTQRALRETAGPSQRGGQNSGGGGAKPRKDGPSETAPKTVFKGVHLREILVVRKGLYKRNGIGGGGSTEVRGGSETVFRGGSPCEVLPPPLFCPPPFGVLWDRLMSRGKKIVSPLSRGNF